MAAVEPIRRWSPGFSLPEQLISQRCPADGQRQRQARARNPTCVPSIHPSAALAIRWLILMFLMAANPAELEAYSGGVIFLPQGNVKPKNGLRLTVDTRWVDANGYRPVRIEARNWPPGPAVADRKLRVVIEPLSWRWMEPTIRVSGQLEILEGAPRGQTILAIPQADCWQQLDISVFEDGELLDDVSGRVQCLTAFANSSEAVPSILIVDADAPTRDDRELRLRQAAGGPPAGPSAPARTLPDVRCLRALFPEGTRQIYYPPLQAQAAAEGPINDVGVLQSLQELPRVELLPPQELPARWIELSCFDLVFISWPDLEALADRRRAAWDVLRDWAASGSTLCVFDMELSAERLAKLNALLGPAGAAGAAAQGAEASDWRAADSSLSGEDAWSKGPIGKYFQVQDQDVGASATPGATPQPGAMPAPAAPPTPKPQPFVYRSFFRGRVVAMQTDEPLAAQTGDAAWLLNQLGDNAWMWYQRHGLSLHRENNEFWNWLVPGIGRAPVGSFLVLITAFVIVIGPVNYFLLRRRRRLYLLLVTVPLGAGLVTLALFAYALISDGLGVRVRVRSFTEIDQRAGRAVSWSRQSYYAGLAPSGGLTFPETAAIYPIEQYPAERKYGGLATQWLIWDQGQNLVSGYIGSRSTSQFLVVQSGPSRRGLSVERGSDQAELWVTNRLDAEIDILVVKDEQGRTLWTRQFGPGQKCRLATIDPAAARRELRAALDVNPPAYPEGYRPGLYGTYGFSNRYYYYGSDVDQNLPSPSFVTGVLECSLAATLNEDVQTWKPRTYVAVTRTSPGVPLGYGRAREEASLHVVLGTW